jgi:hypothetical protein
LTTIINLIFIALGGQLPVFLCPGQPKQ